MDRAGSSYKALNADSGHLRGLPTLCTVGNLPIWELSSAGLDFKGFILASPADLCMKLERLIIDGTISLHHIGKILKKRISWFLT